MASVSRQTVIDADPEAVWDAVRDFHAAHRRLVPGFLTDSRPDGGARVVTFFNGAVARELLVACDDAARRLVWSVADSPLGLTHHNAALAVEPDGDGRSRVIWTADLLPDSAGPRVGELIELGLSRMREALAAAPQAPASAASTRSGASSGGQ
jgi:carbon monoxide dehydrogenase subunit G